MIKFEFTLSDIDAQNLIDCINTAKVTAMETSASFIKESMTNVDETNMHWYKDHAEYLDGLKQQVTHGSTRIK